MADFTDSKKPTTALYPTQAKEAGNQRLEPLLGPLELRNRVLFGIPLVSQMRDPRTGKPQEMTDDLLQDIIDGAIQ